MPDELSEKDPLQMDPGADGNTEPEQEELINEKGKKVLVFNDPLHSKESRSVVNFTTFRGRWEFENIDKFDDSDPRKCAVKFTPVKDGSHLTIAFNSVNDRLEFMNSLYSDSELRQLGGGMNLERFANSKILRTTGGIIGLSLAGYGLYKILSKKKD